VTQRSGAGETPVDFDEDHVWLERGGSGGTDLPEVGETLDMLDIGPGSVGFDAERIGTSSFTLRPAIANAGVPQMMLPLADPATVARLRAPATLGDIEGAYCFAPLGSGRVKARFFAPDFGVAEDPPRDRRRPGSGCI
jgi:predicted PhzF superfamily epimerase YddE/YHI9